jgi:hypothetical protein
VAVPSPSRLPAAAQWGARRKSGSHAVGASALLEQAGPGAASPGVTPGLARGRALLVYLDPVIEPSSLDGGEGSLTR